MPFTTRMLAGALLASSLLLGTLVACGGGATPFAPAGPSTGTPAEQVRDLGRRDLRKPVRVVVLLRYNHQAELERFVDGLERTRRPQYLTRRAFLARYAPTVEQEQRVVSILRGAGFRVTQRYANRLLVDAVAPSGTVERFFSTEIHDFRQPRYGVRSANIRPIRIPAELTPLAAFVEANDLVLLHTGLAGAGTTMPQAKSKNVVKNATFASGKLAPWTSCGPASASISRKHPKDGKYDALTGSASTKQEVKGWSAICQQVTVPVGARLSAWLYRLSNEPNTKHAYQEVALADSSNKPSIALAKTNADQAEWVHETWNLAKYAGKAETLFFGVYGSGRAKYYSTQFVDDVSLIGASPTPAPTASPTPFPTATPVLTPTPSPFPTSTAVSTATPVPGLAPNGGWGPSDVTNGLLLPVIEGDGGQGQTAAIVIDATVAPSDLSTYLQYFNITQTGTVTNEPVDGGSTAVGATEAALDLETISALAPAANVIVYDVPELTDQDVEDAYNQIVSDGRATVVNSSFGACDTIDSTFTSVTDNIAMGAAAQGLTFSAATGDSGVDCYDEEVYIKGVEAPASDPHFVAVGGTQSGSVSGGASGPITNPAVWNDLGAGGGGVSTVWTLPPYQTGLAGALMSGRNVPDIALPAVSDSIYLSGGWHLILGTSWSSPIYVAMQAEINQVCTTPQWGINTLYGAFAKTGYQYDFVNVVNGNNSYGSVSGYSAEPGFDQVSGIGIPLGTQVATDTCGTR